MWVNCDCDTGIPQIPRHTNLGWSSRMISASRIFQIQLTIVKNSNFEKDWFSIHFISFRFDQFICTEKGRYSHLSFLSLFHERKKKQIFPQKIGFNWLCFGIKNKNKIRTKLMANFESKVNKMCSRSKFEPKSSDFW